MKHIFRHLKQQSQIVSVFDKMYLKKKVHLGAKYLFDCMCVCVCIYLFVCLSIYLISNPEYYNTQGSRECGNEPGKERRCALGTSIDDICWWILQRCSEVEEMLQT